MEEAQDAPAYGRTNWRRFAVAVGVPTVVAGGLVLALAEGALAANFTVSGKQFKLTADTLVGTGFTQYSGELDTQDPDYPGGKIPAAMSGIKSATLVGLCQSVAVGPVTLRIEAGNDENNPVKAENLLIGMSELGGNATFEDIQIGLDASTMTRDGAESHGAPGSFGQQSRTVTIENLRQKAYYTSASTFVLNGMSLKLHIGGSHECYQD
ncbi:hypothetical protein FHR83_005712 [Actinoplanes campanulatus]|uniref:Cholesterol esterase n=1 Tax=Actinoplanes campanulatus TaxID=113559 RepID=A0A7W5AKN0_9ACTN|nr:DUF6230 family protein [Actinoplanes campanulatus]MBB3098027.1 hypothetical protein [Actinoplanes campanulatus]GGN31993.1 cholesterol esterase [Actinoplanes campanulatus]GID40101.1 cholesterol esterase [Actinoplanes campanulatus]